MTHEPIHDYHTSQIGEEGSTVDLNYFEAKELDASKFIGLEKVGIDIELQKQLGEIRSKLEESAIK